MLKILGTWSGYTRLILFRMLVCAAFFDALIPLSPFVAHDYSIAGSQMQRTLQLGAIGFSVTQFLAPPLLSALGLQQVLTTASFAVGFLFLSLAASHSFSLFSTLLTSIFIINGLGSLAGRLLLRQELDHQEFQQATATLNAWMNGVEIVSPLLMVAVAATASWRWPLITMSVVMIILALRLQIYSEAKTKTFEAQHLPSLATFKRVMQDRDFVCPTIYIICARGLFSALMICKPFVLIEIYGFSADALGMTLSLLGAITLTGFYATGKLTNRFSDWTRLRAGVLCVVFSSLTLSMTKFFPAAIIFIVGSVFSIGALCLILPLSSAWVINRREMERAHASALFGFTEGIGSSLIALAVTFGPGTTLDRLILVALCTTVISLALTALINRIKVGAS